MIIDPVVEECGDGASKLRQLHNRCVGRVSDGEEQKTSRNRDLGQLIDNDGGPEATADVDWTVGHRQEVDLPDENTDRLGADRDLLHQSLVRLNNQPNKQEGQ